MHAWLATYDHNLTLLDVLNDPGSSPMAVRLAALSLQAGLDSGYYDAEALADAVTQLWEETIHGVDDKDSEAQSELADLLNAGDRYTRALYDAVKLLGPALAARELHGHVKRMRDRADMARIAMAAETAGI